MADRLGQGGDAAMPERVGDKPAPDIRPIAVRQAPWQDGAELHKVTEQHGALGGLGHRQQHLRQGGGTNLVDEYHVVRSVERRP